MSGESKNSGNDFAAQAEGSNSGIIKEFVDLLRHNKKWWLLPVIVALLVLGVLIVLGTTAAAPFIYTLF
jgi:hypothetical protein